MSNGAAMTNEAPNAPEESSGPVLPERIGQAIVGTATQIGEMGVLALYEQLAGVELRFTEGRPVAR